MKLHFEPDLDYQHTAIEAVCDLFRGQEINRTEFTVTRRPRPLRDSTGQAGFALGAFTGAQGELGLVENELGIGNRLSLIGEDAAKAEAARLGKGGDRTSSIRWS